MQFSHAWNIVKFHKILKQIFPCELDIDITVITLHFTNSTAHVKDLSWKIGLIFSITKKTNLVISVPYNSVQIQPL